MSAVIFSGRARTLITTKNATGLVSISTAKTPLRQMRVRQGVAASVARSAAGVVASQFDPATDARDLVAGDVSIAEGASLQISGVQVQMETLPPSAGQCVAVIGRFTSGRLEADCIVRGRFGARTVLR